MPIYSVQINVACLLGTSLQIVPTESWNAVHAIQTAASPRRDAIKRGVIKGRNGVIKRVGGRDSRYWLGTLLVCNCGANYIGDGLRDYVCPAHTSNSCDNDMRIRRSDAHAALFDLLSKEMLNAQGVRTAEAYIKQTLLDQVRQVSAPPAMPLPVLIPSGQIRNCASCVR